MIVNKPVSRRTSSSDLTRVDAHVIKPSEYKELPELTEEMLSRAVVRHGGRPRSEHPRQLISLRLPAEVVARWRATGPGWQTRMAERLARPPMPRAKSEG
ncbi:MAG: BrnA antitoxin family protein [Gammaproteobacteria bacterium]|nr:BrnA antitoxin family protein [Gammaproteobacteria bacterium]MBU1441212.1 BrnA antitoxin family protein [Gammaproteobacteria bacterium]MBU2287564.1 BrnA antitoxin family protein [Gammaproteobacteria bacterium]MBU2407600.1 BrnA antitoxin family protein [Gammaproteobacteria bacterium]